MSWVAEANATSQNTARVAWKKPDVGNVNAMRASPTAMAVCIVTTHHRLVRMMSTKGLQKGFITHGR